MITYELMLVLRVMPKPELVSTLKRIAQCIYDKQGIIRKVENLGTKSLPFKISIHGNVYRDASYYLMEFNTPPHSVEELAEEYNRDVDIIRKQIYKKAAEEFKECTLDEELQPAPYRKDVQELLKKSESLHKPKFDYRTGLDYYPFQK
ncbi:probable 28S ribosomal protein S6, mitochondrial [Agrilus planipennis]|uniref:Small ribosomal subunit protein bS6m n=1 Tax=Agrilus planipennis TaxID=224129 RepID=A0A1W4WY34_AGRPL|nr:probable 28S ribosomal protein S6, mitochondrial [Agrilus planipennis]